MFFINFELKSLLLKIIPSVWVMFCLRLSLCLGLKFACKIQNYGGEENRKFPRFTQVLLDFSSDMWFVSSRQYKESHS